MTSMVFPFANKLKPDLVSRLASEGATPKKIENDSLNFFKELIRKSKESERVPQLGGQEVVGHQDSPHGRELEGALEFQLGLDLLQQEIVKNLREDSSREGEAQKLVGVIEWLPIPTQAIEVGWPRVLCKPVGLRLSPLNGQS